MVLEQIEFAYITKSPKASLANPVINSFLEPYYGQKPNIISNGQELLWSKV